MFRSLRRDPITALALARRPAGAGNHSMRALARRLREERGAALVISLGLMTALGITSASVLNYSAANVRGVNLGTARQSAYYLAESGVNEAEAVLSLSTNNALNPSLLTQRTSTLSTGTVTWSGVLDQSSSLWTITSTGRVDNPTGAAAVTRTLAATVRVTPTLTQPLNSQAWNYIYDWGTGQTCDMTLQQSVQLGSPLYVDGNLCLQNTASIQKGPLVVKGLLTLSQSANIVGSSSAPISEAHIGAGCKYRNNALHNPCQWGATDNVYATIHDSSAPAITPPTVDWDGWYANANPGPKFPCYAPNSSASSTWPIFENETTNPTRNDSVPTAWNLTPSTSYDCWTDSGELGWNATTKVLTVRGSIFIDGSAYIENGAANTYSGQATLFLSGTFLLKNSSLCALLSGSGCDTTNWDPNTNLLVIVANGNGDNGLPAGDGVQMTSGNNGSGFQGGAFATNTIDIGSGFQVDGPLVARTVSLGQSTGASFPFITIVPQGTPGNPNIYAQPGPPTYGG